MSFKLSTGSTVNTSASASISSNSATSATVQVKASANLDSGYVHSTGVMAVITINGNTTTKSVFGNGSSYDSGDGTKTVTHSVSISKGTSSKSISWSVQFWQSNEGTKQTKKETKSGSITVSAKKSYSVKYNANGGSGAPSSQTKWHGTALTLSSTKPTRTGYTFKGWATSSSGSVAYAAGASYTANASVTLYAVWQAKSYTVSYNANGGSGAPSSQTKTHGVALTLSSTKPTRTNYSFAGWATSSSSTSVVYTAGSSYTSNASVTLYAVWEQSYKPPTIASVQINRCTYDGTINSQGTYAYVSFSWSCSQLLGTNNVSSIKVEWKLSTSSSWSSKSISASGSENTSSTIIGSGSLSEDGTFNVRITVTDSMGGSTSVTKTLSTAKFPIDLLSGGTGVSIGKAAELSNIFDIALKTRYRNNILFEYGKTITGTTSGGLEKEIINTMNTNGNLVIGWGNYDYADGNTNIYGNDVYIGVANIDTRGSYKPYLSRGDVLTFNLFTAGYVTGSGKDIHFVVPLSKPILGNPTITATSTDGFQIRQNNKYCYGGDNSTYVKPRSYSVNGTHANGIHIYVTFSNNTNITNNNSVGIRWNGKITFS